MSTPPGDTSTLERAFKRNNTQKEFLTPTVQRKELSPQANRHKKTPKSLSHLFNQKPDFDSHYRLQHLRSGLKRIRKFHEAEINYMKRYQGLDLLDKKNLVALHSIFEELKVPDVKKETEALKVNEFVLEVLNRFERRRNKGQDDKHLTVEARLQKIKVIADVWTLKNPLWTISNLFKVVHFIEQLRNSLEPIESYPNTLAAQLLDLEIPPLEFHTLKTQLLHIDPEESAHFSMLRNSIEQYESKLFLQSEIAQLHFLLNAAGTIHELYLLIHSFNIKPAIKHGLLPLLQLKHHRSLAPIPLPNPEHLDSKPLAEVIRLFEGFKEDPSVGSIKINGKSYNCSRDTLHAILSAFIQELYKQGWPIVESKVENWTPERSAQTEAANIENGRYTPVLQVMRAMTFNASSPSNDHIRTKLIPHLEKEAKNLPQLKFTRVQKTAHLPSTFIFNANHYAVIHQARYECSIKETMLEPNHLPVLIFDAYCVLTHTNGVWTEDLHIKNIQILDMRYNKFLEKAFTDFQNSKITSL